MVIEFGANSIRMFNGRIEYDIVDLRRNTVYENLLMDVLSRAKCLCFTLDSLRSTQQSTSTRNNSDSNTSCLGRAILWACIDFCQKSVTHGSRRVPVNLLIDGREQFPQEERGMFHTLSPLLSQIFVVRMRNFRSWAPVLFASGEQRNLADGVKSGSSADAQRKSSQGLSFLMQQQAVFCVEEKGCEYITKFASRLFEWSIPDPFKFVARFLAADCEGKTIAKCIGSAMWSSPKFIVYGAVGSPARDEQKAMYIAGASTAAKL